MNTSTPNVSAAAAKANKWAARHPDLGSRLERALALIANVSSTLHPDVYVVEGSHGHKYMVRINRSEKTSECTCPDHAKGHHCKHRLSVALYEAA
jgi:uncharacterized Zn finger protein